MIAALAGVFIHAGVFATELSGHLPSALPVSDSPYVVTGDIEYNLAEPLVIEAGCEFRFAVNKEDPIRFICGGYIIAQGTKDAPILFTSNGDPGQPGDWGGILFESSTTKGTYDDNYEYIAGSILSNVIVEYAGTVAIEDEENKYYPAIKVLSAPYMKNLTIRNNGLCGLALYSNACVADSHFIRNQAPEDEYLTPGGASYVYDYMDIQVTAVFSGCRFENNYSRSIGGAIASLATQLILENCTFSGNESQGFGGAVYAKNATITGCVFEENRCRPTNRDEDAFGGAVFFNEDGYGHITDSIFYKNEVDNQGYTPFLNPHAEGAAIYFESAVEVENSFFAGNRASSANSVPGGSAIKGSGRHDPTKTRDSAFVRNQSQGDVVYGNNQEFTHNLIFRNQGSGISLKQGFVTDSTIICNTKDGITAWREGNPLVSQCNIYDNYHEDEEGEPVSYDYRNKAQTNMVAKWNFWNETDELIIKKHIMDEEDDPRLGKVLYGEGGLFLAEPAQDAPPEPKDLVGFPFAVDFGKKLPEDSYETTFALVYNAGTKPVTILDIALVDGGGFAEADCTDCENATLAQDEMCRVSVTFHWKNIGTCYGSIRVTTDNPDDPHIRIPVTGISLSRLDGDIMNSGKVDITDAIVALQILCGMKTLPVCPEQDADGDDRVGMEDALYALWKTAGL